ncbi:MAG: FtsQ-type POTRA domain-containing protein [bacterium]|nr:FtsQ-type POTRA domain-containing protein [bacterium]
MRRRKLKRIKRQRQFYQYKAFWMFLLVAFLGGGIAYSLFLSPWFKIMSVQAQGGDEEIEEQIVVRVVPQNIFLFNTENLEESLKEAFPEITEIVVRKKLPQTISIAFQKRVGVAAWCKTGPPAGKAGQCFSVDAKGIVFQETSPENELVVSFEGNPALGEQLMAQEQWNTILDFQKRAENLLAFRDSNLKFRSVAVVSGTRVEWKTSEQWEAYANLTENLEWQLLKLQAVLEKKIPPERRSSLLYVDLRFGDQAYLKYR